MPKPSRKKPARPRQPPLPPREVDESPSPLLAALIAAKHAKRRGTPKAEQRRAEQRYRLLRERLNRLQDPDTPWAERLRLIEELEGDGWAQYEDWPRLKRRFKYGGREWRIPISRDQLGQLDALEQARDERGYSDFLARIIREHFQQHPELSERILADFESLHYFGAWVACQLWGRDERYSQWLLDNIVKKVRLWGVSPSDKQDLWQAGYEHLLEVILFRVRFVQGRLGAYWWLCVKNHIRDRSKMEAPLLRRPVLCPTCGDEEKVPPYICSRCGAAVPSGIGVEPRRLSLEGVAELEDHAANPEELAAISELRRHLTPRQQEILLRIETSQTNKEIAEVLKVSPRTVEGELAKIREAAVNLEIWPKDLQRHRGGRRRS